MSPSRPRNLPPVVSRLVEAFTRGGGVYPLRGIYYFAAHPFLYPLLRARLLPVILLSSFVLAILFTFTYLPQVFLLAIFQGRASAWFNGTVLVLGEGAAVTAMLFEAFFVDETQVDVFDTVLVAEGYEHLVRTSRPVAPDEDGANPRIRLGEPVRKTVFGPFSLRQIVEFVLLLPLNLVPWFGVPCFLILTGYRAGPLLHWRYFRLRGFDKKQQRAFVKERRWMYTWFGTVALMLQLIPVFSMLFLLTTAAGSALWAIRLEKTVEEGLERQRERERIGEYPDEP